MASGHLQGQLLRMLVQMMRPQRVLELGTFTGYSALSMASGLEPGAVLHTIEVNDEQEDFTRPWIEKSPWADRIQLHIGDALEILKPNAQFSRLGEGLFDFVFIDADKRHYVDYYEAVLPRLRPGGVILADNTLWSGQVTDPSTSPPVMEGRDNAKSSQLHGIMAFNDIVAADSRVEKVILPLRDGLTLIRKK